MLAREAKEYDFKVANAREAFGGQWRNAVDLKTINLWAYAQFCKEALRNIQGDSVTIKDISLSDLKSRIVQLFSGELVKGDTITIPAIRGVIEFVLEAWGMNEHQALLSAYGEDYVSVSIQEFGVPGFGVEKLVVVKFLKNDLVPAE